jgi:hypothetical protein
VVAGGGDGGELGGFFVGEPAGLVERVDADIHQRSAAAVLFGEAPLVGLGVEAEGAFEGLELAEGAGVDDALRL